MIFPLFFHTRKSYRSANQKFIIKKILIASITIMSIISCDEIPSNIIDQKPINLNTEVIDAPDEFYFSNLDSVFVTSIKLNNTDFIEKVWLKVLSYDGSSTIHQQIFMSDEGDIHLSGDKIKGDNIYSALIPMSKKIPSGSYIIEYYVQKKFANTQTNILKYAIHVFNYINSQVNLPPAIIEIVVPSSATYGQRFTLMIKISDPNGLNDISSVYYELYKPDGSKTVNSQGISQFPLFDDGNTSSNGDATANDGIYSVYLTFPSGQPSGQWRFEFYAKDKGGLLSEKAVHYLTLN